MADTNFETLAKLGNTFMPHADSARKDLMAGGGQLAYYTTADTAVKMITNNEFWLRDSRVMNDYTEVRRELELSRSISWTRHCAQSLSQPLTHAIPASPMRR
jgi:hypothetical protein